MVESTRIGLLGVVSAAVVLGLLAISCKRRGRSRAVFLANHSRAIPITAEGAKILGDRLNVDWNRVRLPQFRRGLEIEQEHWTTVDGNFNQVARIALDHLIGDGGLADYYDRLDRMESEAKS